MNVQEFAAANNLRTQKDGCADSIVYARKGSDIFDGYNSGLGICLMFDTKKKWTFARAKMIAAGFTIRQDGDTEGIAVFEPTNKPQVRLALKLSGARAKRKQTPPTPAQLAARARFAEARRKQPILAV